MLLLDSLREVGKYFKCNSYILILNIYLRYNRNAEVAGKLHWCIFIHSLTDTKDCFNSVVVCRSKVSKVLNFPLLCSYFKPFCFVSFVYRLNCACFQIEHVTFGSLPFLIQYIYMLPLHLQLVLDLQFDACIASKGKLCKIHFFQQAFYFKFGFFSPIFLLYSGKPVF